jgi:hypothetical protein
MNEEVLKDVRKTYLLAKATSTMFEYIKHDLSDNMRKAALEAKAKNNYFIKLIDEAFAKRKVPKSFVESEEEISFAILEELYDKESLESERKDNPT